MIQYDIKTRNSFHHTQTIGFQYKKKSDYY